LFVTRDAELAHDEHVERRPQRLGHMRRDRHAAPRQSEDDQVVALVELVRERAAELTAGVVAIAEGQHGAIVRKARATPRAMRRARSRSPWSTRRRATSSPHTTGETRHRST